MKLTREQQIDFDDVVLVCPKAGEHAREFVGLLPDVPWPWLAPDNELETIGFEWEFFMGGPVQKIFADVHPDGRWEIFVRRDDDTEMSLKASSAADAMRVLAEPLADALGAEILDILSAVNTR